MVSVLMTGQEIRERDERELEMTARIAELESQFAAAEKNLHEHTNDYINAAHDLLVRAESAEAERDRYYATLAGLLLSGKLDDMTAAEVRGPGEELQAQLRAAESALAAARERAQMARDCLACSDHWKTEQAENQCMRHLDSILGQELAALRASQTDAGRVERAADRSATAIRERLGWPPISEAQQDANLLYDSITRRRDE